MIVPPTNAQKRNTVVIAPCLQKHRVCRRLACARQIRGDTRAPIDTLCSSRVDRRSVRIKLTDKGREVRDIVENLYQKHVRTVEQVGGIAAEEFSTLNKSLHRLERFWTDQILYRL